MCIKGEKKQHMKGQVKEKHTSIINERDKYNVCLKMVTTPHVQDQCI